MRVSHDSPPIGVTGHEGDHALIESLGPAGSAFFGGFRSLREVQRQAIPRILAGHDVLLASATASGKTEAVLAPLLARTLSRVRREDSGVRMLLIAPTRALVNDLVSRLDGPLGRLNLSCGRQTGDHKQKSRRPFVLITTIESFDSMIVRNGHVERGLVTDHLLAGLVAIFIDEVHLFDKTARGDQLCWLLGRLRRIRRLRGRSGKDGRAGLQVCAGSATISDPEGLAQRVLGRAAVVVRVSGVRRIELLAPSDTRKCLLLDESVDTAELCKHIELAPPEKLIKTAEDRIWTAMASLGDVPMRKALVFVPTRSLVDRLATHLNGTLLRRREVTVLAHHGSLERAVRESAEVDFSAATDAILVATTTLEVGIDIGDVDFVTLIGAPPTTRSLLQRIGRAGRRTGCTRVLAVPRTVIEQMAMASMLTAARAGCIDSDHYARRWSVFIQQAASFVAQGRPVGRKRADLLELARDVWPGDNSATVEGIVQHLIAQRFLVEKMGRLWLGEKWADRFDASGHGMHGNLDSASDGLPAVNAVTGEIIAHVTGQPGEIDSVALSGRNWDINYASGELLLTPRENSSTREAFPYLARRAPLRREYASHVKRGVGLEEWDAPLIDLYCGLTWFHFGGVEYELILCEHLQLRPIATLSGLAVRVVNAGFLASTPLDISVRSADQVVHRRYRDLERVLDVGPYQHLLPDSCRRNVVKALIDLPALQGWLHSRRIWRISSDDPRFAYLQQFRVNDSGKN